MRRINAFPSMLHGMNLISHMDTVNRSGRPVIEGSMVRVLSIDSSVFDDIAPEEGSPIDSMIDDDLDVYELDKWGRAWAEKWWNEKGSRSTSNSLTFCPWDTELLR